MASLMNHYYYRSGTWSSSDSLVVDKGTIGPYDGNSKIRSIFKIRLDSINTSEERTKLRINLKVASAGPGKGYIETLF